MMTLPEPTKLTPEPASERLQMLHMMLHFMDREGERYWQRNGVFVAIVSGLFGLYLAKFEDFVGILSVFYGTFGIIIAVGWLQVLRSSKFYAARWRLDAREYVKRFPDLEDAFRTVAGAPRLERPAGGRSSEVMKIFAYLTAIVAAGILGLGIWQSYSKTTTVIAPTQVQGLTGIATPTNKPIETLCISLKEAGAPSIVDCSNINAPKVKSSSKKK
jgi:hypothetical protein